MVLGIIPIYVMTDYCELAICQRDSFNFSSQILVFWLNQLPTFIGMWRSAITAQRILIFNTYELLGRFFIVLKCYIHRCAITPNALRAVICIACLFFDWLWQPWLSRRVFWLCNLTYNYLVSFSNTEVADSSCCFKQVQTETAMVPYLDFSSLWCYHVQVSPLHVLYARLQPGISTCNSLEDSCL